MPTIATGERCVESAGTTGNAAASNPTFEDAASCRAGVLHTTAYDDDTSGIWNAAAPYNNAPQQQAYNMGGMQQNFGTNMQYGHMI